MTREALVVLHEAVDTPDAIARELESRGVSLRVIRAYAGDAVPERLERGSALVVMGGPMGADDDETYPFLTRAKRLLASATAEGADVLAVCLGSQLLACALGGGVLRGGGGGARPKEVGWYEVERTGADALFDALPRRLTPFHWHEDAIVAPAGSVVLARSQRTPVQAFRFGERVYGIQFHLESSAAKIAAMARALPSDEPDRRAFEEAMRTHIAEQERLGGVLFGAWAERVAGS